MFTAIKICRRLCCAPLICRAISFADDIVADCYNAATPPSCFDDDLRETFTPQLPPRYAYAPPCRLPLCAASPLRRLLPPARLLIRCRRHYAPLRHLFSSLSLMLADTPAFISPLIFASPPISPLSLSISLHAASLRWLPTLIFAISLDADASLDTLMSLFRLLCRDCFAAVFSDAIRRFADIAAVSPPPLRSRCCCLCHAAATRRRDRCRAARRC